MSKEIFEWRGVSDLVAAPLTADTLDEITYGEVFDIAGLANISRTTENGSETHYYDNAPSVVINSVGADTITCSVSGIPLDVLAKITGQIYDEETGMLIEGSGSSNYFALGYKTKTTDGRDIYVWRLKGKFSIPDSTHATETNGTEANGNEITFTGIATTHRFTKTSKAERAITVDTSVLPEVKETFFSTVQTPDTVVKA